MIVYPRNTVTYLRNNTNIHEAGQLAGLVGSSFDKIFVNYVLLRLKF